MKKEDFIDGEIYYANFGIDHRILRYNSGGNMNRYCGGYYDNKLDTDVDIDYVMNNYEGFRLATQEEKITFYKAADEIIKPLSKNDVWCKVDRDFEGVYGICENGYAAKYSSNDQKLSFHKKYPCVQVGQHGANEISCQEMLELMRSANYHVPDKVLNQDPKHLDSEGNPLVIGKCYKWDFNGGSLAKYIGCLLYTSPSPRDRTRSRMPSSA